MAITLNEIEDIARRLLVDAPHLAEEVEQLVHAAGGRSTPGPVTYVEITLSDGTVRILPAKDYQRLTATDLAHSNLRVLTAKEADAHGRKTSTF